MPSRLSKLCIVIIVIQIDVFFQDAVPLLLRLHKWQLYEVCKWELVHTKKSPWTAIFWENAYFFCREFCWLFWNDSLASPHTGNTHFYLKWARADARMECGVNALTRATLISTQSSRGYYGNWTRVSMPSHGQHSFLLYPFKSPYFRRISNPIFVGNSQNILKKAFFRGFTCMFTVCSYLKLPLEPFWLYHIEHLIRHPSFLKRSRAQQTVGKKSHNKEPLRTHQCNPNRK